MARHGMVRRSGIYGLIRLDGGPLAPGDAAMLGLPCQRGAAAIGVDDRLPGALHRADSDGALTILVGFIDDCASLCARLGMAPATPPALIARTALARYGADTPVEMIGEWSLLHLDAGRRLTLMHSATLRDPIFYAIDGATIAIAPDFVALSNLPWVGRDIDPAGLMFALGSAALRLQSAGRTMLAGVQRLEAGQCLKVDAAGLRRTRANALTPQPRWRGSFTEAVEESERLLRGIVAERMQRAGASVAMLSGGLDSSTLVWLAAAARSADRPLALITSVAAPGSARRDERQFADMVAAHLGLATTHLPADPSTNFYRPCDAILHGMNGPPMATRYGMIEPFQHFADAQGAGLLFNGNYGEMTLTAHQPLGTWRYRLRQTSSALRRRLTQPAAPASATGAYLVRLARHRLAGLPDAVADALAAPLRDQRDQSADGLCGYLPGADKALLIGTETYPGAVREDFPFRDLRLLRLFAGFPAEYMTHGGLTRSIARHMLAGQLPDAIRLRTNGLPASPDHLDRLRWQAPAARARIAEFRRAEIDDWIDLDWLDTALQRAAANGLASYDQANDVQLTTVVAEYLLWWRSRG